MCFCERILGTSKIKILRSHVNRKQATSAQLVKKITNREYANEKAKEFSGVLSYRFKLKDNVYKHPKTTSSGCEKVKKLDEENE